MKRPTQEQRTHASLALFTYYTKVDGISADDASDYIRSYSATELISLAKHYRSTPEYQALLKPEHRNGRLPALD